MHNRHWAKFTIAAGLSCIQLIVLGPALSEETSPGEAPDVQERGLQNVFVTPSPPPYSCGSGVCLCVGQDNCNQMTQPQPCKREKFCLGQTASPPPPCRLRNLCNRSNRCKLWLERRAAVFFSARVARGNEGRAWCHVRRCRSVLNECQRHQDATKLRLDMVH